MANTGTWFIYLFILFLQRMLCLTFRGCFLSTQAKFSESTGDLKITDDSHLINSSFITRSRPFQDVSCFFLGCYHTCIFIFQTQSCLSPELRMAGNWCLGGGARDRSLVLWWSGDFFHRTVATVCIRCGSLIAVFTFCDASKELFWWLICKNRLLIGL